MTTASLVRPGLSFGLLLVLVAAVLVTPAGAEPPPNPALTVDPGTVAPGDKVAVVGTDWPGSEPVHLFVCGNDGEGGSASCDLSRSVNVGSDEQGRVSATLVAGIPPVPCPCVVRGLSGSYRVNQPIELMGAPTGVAPPGVRAEAFVTGLQVVGSGRPVVWFGRSSQRVAVVTVGNPSGVPLRDVRLELRWGSGDSARSRVVDRLPEIPAQGETVVRAAIQLPAMTWGRLDVRARIVGAEDEGWVSAPTSVARPWGLVVVVALVLLQLVLLAIRNIVRRGKARRRVAAAGRASASPEATAVVLRVPSPDDQIEAEPPPHPERVGAGQASSSKQPTGGT